VDPEHDTPEALAEYAQRFQADSTRWHLLTGDVVTLDRLCDDVFMLGSIDGRNLDHSTRFVLVDRDGVVRGYYMSGDSASMEQLEADVRLLAGA
jgi:protein SCO1/2